MGDVLFWVYFVNAVLLISHEIDSAYWREWELFRLPGGLTLFLLLHFPSCSWFCMDLCSSTTSGLLV